MKIFVLFFCLCIFTLSPSISNAQSLWEFGTIPFGGGCAKNGYPLIPGIDPWIQNLHCVTHEGTVGCMDEYDMGGGVIVGECKCNLDNSHFSLPLQKCVGKVGAICSAEHSTVFPDKLCTPNADCIPIQGEGHSIGKCQCIYGFKEDVEGMCIEDVSIEPGKQSTPRTTTTSEAPERGEFKLPLDILLGLNTVAFEEECRPKALLNRTLCNTHSATVSCQNNKCLCNMQDDSRFDDKLNMCVGLAGTHCLGRKYILGYKACTEFADCVLEEGTSFDDGYSFGTCECIHGYEEDADGLCVRNDAIPDPSTQRTIVPPATAPTTTKATPAPPPPSGAVGIYSTGYATSILLSILYMIIY